MEKRPPAPLRVRSYEFSFRTETAMFLHGGEGLSSPELRVSAIKGLMRYWFRTAAGCFASPRSFRKLENELFGSIGVPAAFQLSVAEFNRQQAVQERGRFLLPHKEQPNVRQSCAAIRSGITFGIRVSPRSGGTLDLTRYELILWTLWAAANLGGFGLRSRRGAGSVSIRKVSPPLDQFVMPRDCEGPEVVAEILLQGISRFMTLIKEVLGVAPEGAEATTQRFADRQTVTVASIAPGALDEQEVRRTLMLTLRPFKNPAFGLPLRLESGWVQSSGSRRFASPLQLRLFRGKESWMLVATNLRPLPEAEGVSAQQIEAYLASLRGVSLSVTPQGVARDSVASS